MMGSPRETRRIIDVDASGADAKGETYRHRAARWAVKKGYVVNEAVLLRYPDGSTREAVEVRMTAAGITAMAKEMSLGTA